MEKELKNKMPRKDTKDYTQMQIKRSILKRLKKLKIHPQQSYTEVIEKLLNGEKFIGNLTTLMNDKEIIKAVKEYSRLNNKVYKGQ